MGISEKYHLKQYLGSEEVCTSIKLDVSAWMCLNVWSPSAPEIKCTNCHVHLPCAELTQVPGNILEFIPFPPPISNCLSSFTGIFEVCWGLCRSGGGQGEPPAESCLCMNKNCMGFPPSKAEQQPLQDASLVRLRLSSPLSPGNKPVPPPALHGKLQAMFRVCSPCSESAELLKSLLHGRNPTGFQNSYWICGASGHHWDLLSDLFPACAERVWRVQLKASFTMAPVRKGRKGLFCIPLLIPVFCYLLMLSQWAPESGCLTIKPTFDPGLFPNCIFFMLLSTAEEFSYFNRGSLS